MTKTLRIATRASRLATAQAQLVAQAVSAHYPSINTELVKIITTGDRADGPLVDIGGKGAFTIELERALADGSVDLAVHSAKDVPADLDASFTISAVPMRADPRDAIVSRGGKSLLELPAEAVVGTSSPRRTAQIRAIRQDLQIAAVRGNVDTRLHKALDENNQNYDAIMLAQAGLIRSGLTQNHAADIHPLEIRDFIPAAGQGALALEILADNNSLANLLEPLNHEPSRQALLAERAVVASLDADCHSCLAIHVSPLEKKWQALAFVANPDGSEIIRLKVSAQTPSAAGQSLLKSLLKKNAKQLLAR